MTTNDIVQILTAIGVIITAVVSYLNRGKISATADKVDGVQHTVNSQADRQTARVDQLATSLQQAGIDVPPRPANDPTSEMPPSVEPPGAG
jgi:hypothetical protein